MNIWQWFDLPKLQRPPLYTRQGYIPFMGWTIGALWGVCKSDYADKASYDVWYSAEVKHQDNLAKAQPSHFRNHDTNVGLTLCNPTPPATIKPWPYGE